MNTLLIRNISITPTKLTYDLYFSYDSSYSIQVGKVLGFRVHEYGSEYVVQLSGSIENAVTRYAGYGNGGDTSALFINSLDPSKSELFIGTVSWTIDPNSVSQVRTDWSAVLNNFGSDEYATVAMGFSQVTSYSARDVQLSSKSVFIESAINQLPLGSVSINGSPSPGEILTASNNLSDKDGVGVVTYQWQYSNEGKIWNNLVVGPSITVTDSQVTKFIRVNATYIDGKGNNELVSSIDSLKILPPAPAPTIALSANKTNLITGDSANVTFFLSEVSTNFIVSDVIITGGKLTNFTGSGATYFAIFTPTENSNLFGTISVPDAVFTNASGKANADGLDLNNKIIFGVDTVIPTIAVSSNKSSLQGGDSATLTFTLSEASTNFVASDITVIGGTLSNFSGSGTSYTATLTPTVNSTTSGTVSVASGVFSDAAGNVNAGGSDAKNTITLAVDTVVPTIALSASKTSLIAGDTTTLTFTLSEASTNFAASDITVTGGTLSNFSGNGTSYTALFTSTANGTTSGSVSVASGVFTDAAGNLNADGLDANNKILFDVSGNKVWTRLLGSGGDDDGYSLTTGLDGSIYISGYTTGSLDGQANSGGEDGFVTKYSPDGVKVWTRLIGSKGDDRVWSLTTGRDGSIYLSGETTGSLDGQANSGGLDGFVTKYSPEGVKLWTHQIGSSKDDYSGDLTTGLDGFIYVSGGTAGSLDGKINSGGLDAFLTKYNPDGSKVWTQWLETSGHDIAGSIATGIDGSVYFAGQTRAVTDAQTSFDDYDAFLTKYSPEGVKIWTRSIATDRGDQAWALSTGLDGSIFISGFTYGSLDGQINSGDADGFVTKYSPDGVKVWTQLLGTSNYDEATALTTGLDGSIYVSGYTSGSLDGQVKSGSIDGFLTKFNSDGTKVWTRLIGTGGFTEAYGLTTGLDGSIYISGFTTGSLDGQVNKGGTDAFLIKFKELDAIPTFSISASNSLINEGSSTVFTLSVKNLASGTSVPYTLSGISAADISGGQLSGNAVINSNGVATISVSVLNDSLTEGSETLTVTAGGVTTSTVINDTSKSAATYSLNASNPSINEGSSVTFTLSTANLDSGTSIPYTLSGINAADISGGLLSGNAVINVGGVATVSITLLNDLLTESQETLTITAGGATASTVINDTSKSAATYSLNASSPSINEGSSVTFNLSTANLASGTSVPYTLSGVSAADISGGLLSGNAVINSSGVATISVSVLNDSLTEGSETLTVTAGGVTASTVINDTSKSVVTTWINAGRTSANEGELVSFVLLTIGIPADTSVPYTISGISSADIAGGKLTGNAVINSGGVATISVTLLNDSLTEGSETLTIGAGGASASIEVMDTSTSKKTALENHNLSVVVDKGVLGVTATLLKNLVEMIVFVNGVMTKHTIQYAGNTFDYDSIDNLITTVTRDGEFTAEFTKEINDYLSTELNISYSSAVKLVGTANIDAVILSVAGDDGNYVG
jgi:hypothetical protein